MKLTPWFSGDQKPVRVGVYQRDIFGKGIEVYSYWNGNYWCFYSSSVSGAVMKDGLHLESAEQNLPWRGVMK